MNSPAIRILSSFPPLCVAQVTVTKVCKNILNPLPPAPVMKGTGLDLAGVYTSWVWPVVGSYCFCSDILRAHPLMIALIAQSWIPLSLCKTGELLRKDDNQYSEERWLSVFWHLREESIQNLSNEGNAYLSRQKQLNFRWFGLCQFRFLGTECTEGKCSLIYLLYSTAVWDREWSK